MSAYALLALTLGPGFLILAWIFYKDKYEKEPIGLLLGAFITGALSTLLVLGAGMAWARLGFRIDPDSILTTAFFAFISVGATEELAKLLVVLLLFYPRKAFNEPFDGIVYCTAVSMGFATAENVLYVYVNASPGEALWLATLRMFSAVPAHATFAILMGYFVGISKFNTLRLPYILLGWFVASLFHGAYDFFLFLKNIPGISLGAFFSLYVGIRYARKAIRINQAVSPFKPESVHE